MSCRRRVEMHVINMAYSFIEEMKEQFMFICEVMGCQLP